MVVAKAEEELGKVGGAKYIDYIGYPEGVNWCSIFTCWVLESYVLVPDGCGYSPNWFPGDKILDSKEDALRGDVIGIYYRNLGRIGHTGILVEDWGSGNMVTTIEGNMSNRVVKKFRSKNQISRVSNWIN